jgi:hypothetical protein
MTREYSFEIWQDGVCVAGASGTNGPRVMSEIMRYARQYMQDGAIEIRGKNKQSGELLEGGFNWLKAADRANKGQLEKVDG